jgi:hypothetical protein
VFEISCGIHWPCAGSLRSTVVPEDVRAGVMNMFRVPLNLIVILVLLKVQRDINFENKTLMVFFENVQIKALQQSVVFFLCFGFMAIAFGAAVMLMRRAPTAAASGLSVSSGGH